MDFSPRLIEEACRTELDADRAVLRSYVHGVTHVLGFAESITAAEELLEAFHLYQQSKLDFHGYRGRTTLRHT